MNAGTPALGAAAQQSPSAALPPGAKATTQPQHTGAPDGLRSSPLGRVLWTFKRELFWVFVFSAFANLLMLTPTLYMLQLFDRVMLSGNGYTLIALTAAMVFFLMLMAFSDWVRSRLLVRAGARLDEAVNRQVFAAAFAAQITKAQRSPQQPLNDLNTVRQFLTGSSVFAFVDTPWALVFIAVIFLMHPWLGWLAVAFCVVQLAMGFALQRSSQKRQSQEQDLALESTQYLQAKLRNAETVESMGMQGNLRVQWTALSEKQSNNHALVQDHAYRMSSLLKFMQYTQQALMLSLGALLAMEGKITAGAMIASNALMGNALRPIGSIVQAWGQTAQARSAYMRLNDLLKTLPTRPTTAPAAKVVGQMTLRNLTATAEGRKTPILSGLNADFRAGEVVGIVGPSGAGKSTLARCLLGIWPNAQGDVLLDGVPLQSWPRQLLGPHVGYLPQDVELFEGTVAENIGRFGQHSAETVIEAAQRAGIHDMVLRMPKGYDTLMGEGGGTLSGGQRQRLGLARALVGNPRVVVLDEPGANLDDAGEAALLQAVFDLKVRGCTVFLIVHQPHLLRLADRLLVLESGQITRLAAMSAVGARATPSAKAAAAATGPASSPSVSDPLPSKDSP